MKNPKENLESLEDRIIDLSLQLKNAKNEVKSINTSHKKLIKEVTHSLINSTGIVVSFSEMILGDFKMYDENKLKRYLSIVNTSGKYSIHFLNQLMRYSRLTSPKPSSLYVATNYIDLLNKSIDGFSSLIFKRQIAIHRNFENVKVNLLIDVGDITLAISQIIKNAIRFSSNQTTISISVIETEEFIETIIKDDGIGVSEVDIEDIFNEFFVVNSSSCDNVKCVGLGLTIAKKIIKNHRGVILFESILGQGSSVKIRLPKTGVLTLCE